MATKSVERLKISCPNCGAPVTLRTFQNASRVHCEYCDSLIDNEQGALSIVQRFKNKMKIKPKIPIGRRGKFEGRQWEIVGFMKRSTPCFFWFEYLLFNPYHGFRFLADSDGHWSFVTPIQALPRKAEAWHPSLAHGGVNYKQYASYQAEVTYVLGEFFWKVEVGDRAAITDYIAPPDLISAEAMIGKGEAQQTYSRAHYLSPEEVFSAFSLNPPRMEPRGVMPNQPNPHAAGWREIRQLAALFFGIFLLAALSYLAMSDSELVLRESIPVTLLSPDLETPAAKVITTEGFRLESSSNASVKISVPSLRNSWVKYDGQLVNQRLQISRPFTIRFAYLSGAGWSDGTRSAEVMLGGLRAGDYRVVLRPTAGMKPEIARNLQAVIQITRDVPLYRHLFLVFLILCSVPALQWLPYIAFEGRRWKDSDFGASS